MKNITILIIGLFITLTMSVVEIMAQPIDVITFHHPPYMNGDGTGIAEQIVTAAFQKKGHVVNFTTYPRKRAIFLFKQGKGNFFLGLPVYFSEQKIVYSEIIYLRSVLVFLNKRYPKLQINEIDDLKGKTIGISLGASQAPFFQAAGLIVVEVPKGENTIRMLHKGRIDFFYTLDLTATKLIKKFYQGQRHAFGFLEYKRIGGGLVARKNSPSWALFKEFKSGLSSIISTNEYLHIMEQHYGSNQVPASALIE